MKNVNYLIEQYTHNGAIDTTEHVVVWNDENLCVEDIIYFAYSSFGEGGIDYKSLNIVEMTEEIQSKVDLFMAAEIKQTASVEFSEALSDCDVFNERKPYQHKGQVIEVISGRKNKGDVGVVFWEGVDKYSTTNNNSFMGDTILKIISMGKPKNSKFNRIGVKRSNGEVFFINTKHVRVIDGFEEVTTTLEEVEKIIKLRRKNMKNLFR